MHETFKALHVVLVPTFFKPILPKWRPKWVVS